MKLKFFKRLFLTLSVILVISLFIILTTSSFLVSNYFSREKFEFLNVNSAAVADIAVMDMNSINFKRNIFNIISIQKNVSAVDTFICNGDGSFAVCGCNDFLGKNDCIHENFRLQSNVMTAAAGEGFSKIGKMDNLFSEEQFMVCRAIKDSNGTVYGYVFSSTSAEELRTLLATISRIFIVSCIVPIVIMFFALYAIAYRFSKPLKLMSEAAKCMAKGDFSKRIPIMSDDEIGELSISFNNMTNHLAQLEQMRRSFIGNVSHELRTPMTTIAGFIDGIIDGTIGEDRRDYYLKTVSNEVKRLSRVVESTLNLAKLEAGEIQLNPTEFSISKTIVDVVISREQQIAEKQIEILGLDRLDDTKIVADYDMIYQVIYNLIDNAVKFTEFGGKITFDMLKTDKNVQFSIKNTGKGISKDGINHIFERFYKEDKARSYHASSTGLGLFIVKTIIDIHGGKIVAESIENEYTLFKVLLPNMEVKLNG